MSRSSIELVPDDRPDAIELLADGALGVPEAVGFAGVSRATLYEAMAEGELCLLRGRNLDEHATRSRAAPSLDRRAQRRDEHGLMKILFVGRDDAPAAIAPSEVDLQAAWLLRLYGQGFDHGSARIRHLEAKVVDGMSNVGMSNFVELTFYERAPCLARPNQARGSA